MLGANEDIWLWRDFNYFQMKSMEKCIREYLDHKGVQTLIRKEKNPQTTRNVAILSQPEKAMLTYYMRSLFKLDNNTSKTHKI